MDVVKGLGGKYFINQLQSREGVMLMRGRILGPVASEHSPYYLCDVYPADDREIGVSSQTLVSLDQLTGVTFYADKATQDAAWDELQRQRRAWNARQKAAEAESTPAGPLMIGKIPPEMAEALGLKVEEEKPPAKPRLRRLRKPRNPE